MSHELIPSLSDDHALTQQNEFVVGRYRLHYEEFMQYLFHTIKLEKTWSYQDMKMVHIHDLEVLDTQTNEHIALSFRCDESKKLIAVEFGQNHSAYSRKEYDIDKDSKAARHYQFTTRHSRDDYHAIIFDAKGDVWGEDYSSSTEDTFYDFVDEQEFMKAVKAGLIAYDASQCSERLQQMKEDILRCLAANIVPAPAETLLISG